MNEVEFSRTLRNETIGAAPHNLQIEAEEAERAALAQRFGLTALDRLEADLAVSRTTADILVTGRIRAEASQSCVVTGEPVAESIDEPFELRFREAPSAGGAEEEIELGEDEMDVMFTDGALIDVGEAVAQTLALNLNPYPRAPGAQSALQEAGVKGESEAGPFGALAGLKDKLQR